MLSLPPSDGTTTRDTLRRASVEFHLTQSASFTSFCVSLVILSLCFFFRRGFLLSFFPFLLASCVPCFSLSCADRELEPKTIVTGYFLGREEPLYRLRFRLRSSLFCFVLLVFFWDTTTPYSFPRLVLRTTGFDLLVKLVVLFRHDLILVFIFCL